MSADSGEPTILTTFGLVFSSSRTISTPSVAMSTAASSKGLSAAPMMSGSMVGRSPCTLTIVSTLCPGSSAVSASKMRSEPDSWSDPRHHRLETMRAHRLGHALRIGGDHHPAEPGLGGAAGDVNDHRNAGNVGQRLARQAGRGHAGRDEDQGGHEGRRRVRKEDGKSGKRSHWKRPYRCCNARAKDLVSARFDRLRGVGHDTDGRSGRIGPPEKGAWGVWILSKSTS